jgi:zinc and cadmium transporter
MSTLGYIVVASLAGGLMSALAAGLVAYRVRAEWIPMLVSFSVGGLLGAAFLELLPHAFERSTDFRALAGTVLAGILGFFLLEKLVIWRHSHGEEAHGHGHDHGHSHGHDQGRSGSLIIIGDSFHNFVDGVLIAAAFMESTALGVVAAAAVIAHEIPQEVGDFLVLLHSGFTRGRAMFWNVVSSLAMLAGGLLGYAALQVVSGWTTTLVAISAASMIYVAVADLIPGLHRRPELGATLQQMVLIALGVAMIAGIGMLTHGH